MRAVDRRAEVVAPLRLRAIASTRGGTGSCTVAPAGSDDHPAVGIYGLEIARSDHRSAWAGYAHRCRLGQRRASGRPIRPTVAPRRRPGRVGPQERVARWRSSLWTSPIRCERVVRYPTTPSVIATAATASAAAAVRRRRRVMARATRSRPRARSGSGGARRRPRACGADSRCTPAARCRPGRSHSPTRGRRSARS